MTDADYEKRQAVLAKLSKEDAELMQNLTSSRRSDIYMGMTDGFTHLRVESGTKFLSLSCQETPVR